MGPRLEADLLADRRAEALAPTEPRESPVDVDLGVRVDELGVVAHVVVDGRELDQLAEERDGAGRPQVLVADDGLSHGLRLGSRGPELLAYEVEGQEPAVELER